MMDNTTLPGETILLETKKFKWLKDITAAYNIQVETIEIGDENTISLKKRIPFYKYFINYLLTINYAALGVERREVSSLAKDIFESIENGDSHPMLESLADFILNSFYTRGFDLTDSHAGIYEFIDIPLDGKTSWDKSFVTRDLKADTVSRKRMIAYAFGLGMDDDELETFLMKVLEETGLNIWDKKEALVYISFRHFPENSIEFYNRAIDLYDKTLYIRNDGSVEQIPGMNTVVLQNSINQYLKTLENTEKLDDDLIIDIITYHKELVSENTIRTIKSEFINTFKDLSASFYPIGETFDEDFLIEDRTYHLLLDVNILYTSEKDLSLGPDDKFVFEDKKCEEKVVFYPIKLYTLSKTSEKVEIRISLKSEGTIKQDKVDKIVANNKAMDLINISSLPEIKDLHIVDSYMASEQGLRLLDYLYSEEGLIDEDEATLTDEQLRVLGDLLKDSQIKAQAIFDVIVNDNIDRISRSGLVTLFFLDYLKNNHSKWTDILRTPAKRKRDYLIFMDHKLRNCRLYEYNISNPYEDVLLKLIVDDEPIDIFRDLWAKYLYNSKTNRN